VSRLRIDGLSLPTDGVADDPWELRTRIAEQAPSAELAAGAKRAAPTSTHVLPTQRETDRAAEDRPGLGDSLRGRSPETTS